MARRNSVLFLSGNVTRRQALRVGGLTALGLVFSRPIISTLKPSPAYAQVSSVLPPLNLPSFANGSFETGDFTSWNILSAASATSAQVLSELGQIFPTDGNYMAKIDTGYVNGVRTIIGTDPFVIPAGATYLAFDFNFLTNANTPALNDDNLRAILSSPSGDIIVNLADTHSSFIPATGSGFDEQTGFESYMFDVSAHAGLPTPSSFGLDIGVTDGGSTIIASAGLIDNVRFL